MKKNMLFLLLAVAALAAATIACGGGSQSGSQQIPGQKTLDSNGNQGSSQSIVGALIEAQATNVAPIPYAPGEEVFSATSDSEEGTEVIYGEKVLWQLEDYVLPSGQTLPNTRLTLTLVALPEAGQMYCLITSGGNFREEYLFDRYCWPVDPAD